MRHPHRGTHPRNRLYLAAGLVVIFSACSKSEPPPKSSSPPPKAPVSQAPGASADAPLVPRKSVDYMAGLRNSKDESKAVTREEMERSAKQVVQSAEASKAATAAKVEAQKVVDTKAAPQQPAPVAAAPAQQAPVSTPPPAPRPSAPADNVVAKAAPTSAAPAPSTTTTPVSREAPEFPREAIRSGIDNGMVKARLSIDSAGNVTGVQIVEARPARVFDRTVRETLAKWKFNAGSDGRSYDAEVEFKR